MPDRVLKPASTFPIIPSAHSHIHQFSLLPITSCTQDKPYITFHKSKQIFSIFSLWRERENLKFSKNESAASSIRILLQFQDKGCATCGHMRSYRPSTSSAHYKMSFQDMRTKEKSKVERRVHGVATHDDTGQKDLCAISLRMLKRASPYSSTVLDAYTGTQNVNAVGREGKSQRVDQATFRRKLDAFGYPGVSPIENCTHNTFYNGVSGYHDLNRAKVDTAVTGSNIAGSSEENDFDCDASSVGSCSASSMRADKFSNFSVAVPFLGTDLLSTDAESYCRSLDEEENLSHCSEENVEVRIHKLELHAYRCTLEALYASGPLSWDKELLLTNLRIMLHISNDEHLTELKNLIPSGST